MTSLGRGLEEDLLNRLEDLEEEEDLVEQRSYNLDIASKANLLLVSTCGLSKAFLSVFLLGKNAVQIGRVEEISGPKDAKDDAQRRDVAQFYETGCEGAIACHVKEDPSYWVNGLAEKVLEASAPGGSVIVLKSHHLTELKGISDNAAPADHVLRYLMTANWKELIPRSNVLERPNVATGVAAAVLTLAEFSQRPALALLAYLDFVLPDSISLSAFSPLLDLSVVKQYDKFPRKDAGERIKQLAVNEYGNIYL